MDEFTLKSASEVDAATVVTSPKKPLEKGKREAEDAIEEEILSAKKLKMEETDISSKEDSSCANSKQEIKVKLCAENGLVDSESGNERIGLVEEASVAEKKPSIATNDGHSAASKRKDESIDYSDCSAEDETSLHEVAAATEKAHESLTKKDIVAPAKKTNDSNSSSADITNLNEDIAAPNEATIIPSAEKSVVSTEKKDVVNSDEIHSDVTCSDENVTTAKKAPIIYPTERGLVISKKTKNESSSNDGSACEDDVNAKITSEVVTIKKNVSSGESESESDNETSRLDDEPKAPVTPKEQTTGPKTLFVGNLSFSVEREDVEDFFKAAGEVVNIRFGMNLDESFRGFGYVEFSSTEAAEKALHELNGKELLHRPVRLDLMKNRGRYTQYSSSKDTLPFQRGGRAEGQRRFVRGFNKFDGEDQALHEHIDKEILPHPVRPDFVKERGLYIPYSGKDTQFQNGGRAQGQKVFICGFNKIDGEYQIRSSLEEHFGSCGEISRVSVPKDQDGSVRGIAFIDFKDNDGFTQALKLNGSEFRGSTLSVEKAKPRWDGRDNSGGSSSGCGWRRGGGREFGGRSGGWDLGGSSGRRDFGGRSGGWDFNGRGGRQDFSGRGGGWDFGGRGGRQDFGGRSGGWDFGGRDGRQDFGGGSGGWDFGGRSGRQNFGGRSGGWDLRGRSGRQDFGGRSGSRGGGGFGGGGRSWNWNESTIRQ